tara:strand:- start:73864 stop:74166 length:303 start_codon:yes stop_codon:yes gene_type:complete
MNKTKKKSQMTLYIRVNDDLSLVEGADDIAGGVFPVDTIEHMDNGFRAYIFMCGGKKRKVFGHECEILYEHTIREHEDAPIRKKAVLMREEKAKESWGSW